MVGIASSPVILILAFTGAYWNISLVIHEVEHIIEEPYYIEKQLHSQNISIQKLLDSNQETIKDFEATYLLMPFEPPIKLHVWAPWALIQEARAYRALVHCIPSCCRCAQEVASIDVCAE